MGSKHGAGGGGREIVLADMDSVGADRTRDVDAVIDDERNAAGGEERLERHAGFDHLTRGSVLLAELHDGYSAGDGGGHRLQKAAAGGHLRIGDEIQREV